MHQNRRHFLKTTAGAAATGLLAPLGGIAAQGLKPVSVKAGYELLF
ncbi:twin-arginine translocation signal domain-containing protein, partial [Pedobacter sp.]